MVEVWVFTVVSPVCGASGQAVWLAKSE
jgi:hypothetical protein